MLFSIQQEYIVSVLRQIKYIRARQLYAMTVQHFRTQGIDISKARMDAMLRQLRAVSNLVRFQGGRGLLRRAHGRSPLSGGHRRHAGAELLRA